MNQEEIKKEEELIKEKVSEEMEELKEDVVEEIKKEEERIEEDVKEKFEEIEKEAEEVKEEVEKEIEGKKEEVEEKLKEIKEVEEDVEEKIEEGVEEIKEVEEAVEEKVEEIEKEKVVGYKKADVFKRFVAYLIDAILAGIVASLIPFIGGLAACAYMLLRDGLDFTQNRSIGKMAFNLKPIVAETGANCDLMTSAKRNWPLAIGYIPSIISRGWYRISIVGGVIAVLVGIPLLIYIIIEAVLIFTDKKGLRLGDKMAGTQVVEL